MRILSEQNVSWVPWSQPVDVLLRSVMYRNPHRLLADEEFVRTHVRGRRAYVSLHDQCMREAALLFPRSKDKWRAMRPCAYATMDGRGGLSCGAPFSPRLVILLRARISTTR